MKTILFLFISLNIFAQSWEKINTENTCMNRHENALVAVGNTLVLIGGRGIKPVESFDIKSKTWTKKVETPLEMHHFQAIAFKGEVWVLGAFTGKYPHETPIENIHIFNLEKNEWRLGPAIPKDRLRGAAGVFEYKEKIYMVCGIQDGHWDGHVAWLDEYNPKTDTWTKLADAPHVRDHVQAAVVGNKIYIAGGRKSYGKIKDTFTLTEKAVDVYDFKTGKWATLSEDKNIPTPRAGTSSVVLGKKLVVLGGESGAQTKAHAEVEAFDIKTQTWLKLPNMLEGRHGTGAAVIKGKIYTAAGSGNRGGGPELNTVEVLR